MSQTEEFTDLYLRVLAEGLGFKAVALVGGSVMFSPGACNFVVRNFATTDPEFLHISIGFALDPDSTALASGGAANAVNGRCKGVTVQITDQGVLFATQMLTAPPGALPSAIHLMTIIPRCITMLRYATEQFHVELELAGILSSPESP